MEFEKPREKSGAGTGPLVQLGKLSASLISDSLRIARLAFVHVSAAEMMAEDATNTEEWGPTTTAMAAISEASKDYDDYERIVQVLRGRLALNGTKYWRQIYKALTVMEYLLTHGKVQFITDFRMDMQRVKELTRFAFIDENLVDRGSALQSKARQVHLLLVDERFFKMERKRAQTVSKGILGFGSQSVETFGSSISSEKKCNTQSAGSLPPKVEKVAHIIHSPPCGPHDSATSSPTSQRSTSWRMSVNCPADDSPQMSSASTEWNAFDDSPTSSECHTSSSSPIGGGWTPPTRNNSPTRKLSDELDMCNTVTSKPDLLLKPQSAPLPKLPPPPKCRVPPPPKCRVPPPPPRGSKVRSNALGNSSLPRPQIFSDFITL